MSFISIRSGRSILLSCSLAFIACRPSASISPPPVPQDAPPSLEHSARAPAASASAAPVAASRSNQIVLQPTTARPRRLSSQTAIAVQPKKSPRRPGIQSEYTVAKREVDAALSNLNKVATQARIVPVFENGQARGFKLFSIRPQSLYAKLGLRNGDIVTHVNGREINSPDRALAVYSKLKDAKTVSVELLRKGQKLTLSYDVPSGVISETQLPPSEGELLINPTTKTSDDPLSTFAVDVDTASYSLTRRRLLDGRFPWAPSVRVEEFLNYFHYDYEPPPSGNDRALFAIEADGAVSPIDPSKRLLRIGIQAKTLTPAQVKPVNLVFLVDTSCSMTSSDKLDLAKTSMKLAVAGLGSKDRVAITTYAGGVAEVLPPTFAVDRTAITQAIDSLQPLGGTAMQSGMQLAYRQAASMLQSTASGRSGALARVVVLSDGDANIGATDPGSILRYVERYTSQGVTLSTVGYGQGNYRDDMMEGLANRGNGNYHYVDSLRQAERVFRRDLQKITQEVAQDVKIQVEFHPESVLSYRLIGFENRAVADADFRQDEVDAGEIGAGHQVTALYELTLTPMAQASLATIRVRAKRPRGLTAKEARMQVSRSVIEQPFHRAPSSFRFATAVMGAAELFRKSPHAEGWTFEKVIAIAKATESSDPDRTEFIDLMQRARDLRAHRLQASR